MLTEHLPVATPAFVYDETRIEADCRRVSALAREAGCKLLFSVKALSIAGVLEIVGRSVDGFSTSSPFETLLVHELFGDAAIVHMTSPGLSSRDLSAIADRSLFVSFNSIPQFERIAADFPKDVQLGIRINPELSLVSDSRYDPCRPHSKLGATAREANALFERAPSLAKRLSGLMVHNNCDADDFSGLLRTVKRIDSTLERILPSFAWINLGGGYSFPGNSRSAQFFEAVRYLKSRYDVEVFIEPGAALVRGGVQLVASVVDLFERDGKAIAVLDASVNHMPEVLEYRDVPDSEPWVLGHMDDGRFPHLLAGSTCLAGDIFGDYAFDDPLAIGDQIVFPEMGAYAFAKAHWFNGVNLPSIYAKSIDGRVRLRHRFAFSDFARHNGLVLGGA
jgi:carboxynorspermidine decarboxylase